MLPNLRISRSLYKTLDDSTIKTHVECICFEENITCLNLMDKYFPTLRLHSLNKEISVYNNCRNKRRSRISDSPIRGKMK